MAMPNGCNSWTKRLQNPIIVWQFWNCISKHLVRLNEKNNSVFFTFTVIFDSAHIWHFNITNHWQLWNICYSFQGCVSVWSIRNSVWRDELLLLVWFEMHTSTSMINNGALISEWVCQRKLTLLFIHPSWTHIGCVQKKSQKKIAIKSFKVFICLSLIFCEVEC